MADDDSPPPQPESGDAPRRGLWPLLGRRRHTPAAPADAALGYESAQPWTLADVADDGQPTGG